MGLITLWPLPLFVHDRGRFLDCEDLLGQPHATSFKPMQVLLLAPLASMPHRIATLGPVVSSCTRVTSQVNHTT
jgi:hypothetical protein